MTVDDPTAPGEQILIDALADGRLVDALEPPSSAPPQIAARLSVTCERIGAETDAVLAELVAALTTAGVAADPEEPGARQRHAGHLDVESADAARRAVDVLRARGFVRWEPLAPGAEASFWRNADAVAMARTGDVTTVVTIRWPRPVGSRAQAALRPTILDWTAVAMPVWAASLYRVVRPARIISDRLSGRARNIAGLGPPLATPRSVVVPLIAAAGIGPDDVVADLGCGDARLLVDVVQASGCRGLGVEQSPGLAAAASQRVVDAGLDERIRIECADATDADAVVLDDVSVVLAFLPFSVLAPLIASLPSRLLPTARIVAHEQARLPDHVPAPQQRRLLVGDDAVSTAFRWDGAAAAGS